MTEITVDDLDKPIKGAAAIGAVLGLTEQQAFYHPRERPHPRRQDGPLVDLDET